MSVKKYMRRSLLGLSVLLLLVADGSAVGAQLNPRADFFNLNDITYYDDTDEACVVSGGGTASTPTSSVPTSFSLGEINVVQAHVRQVALMKALMSDYGLSAAQAAGVVGNFMHESGGKHLPPNVNEGGIAGPPRFSGGYGWAQWTGPRQRSFINFAVDQGFMASRTVSATDAANYAYLRYELDTAYKSTVTELKKQTTPETAAVSFEATFEKAGVPAISNRTKYAREAFEAFSGGGGGPTTIGSGNSCNAPTGSAGIVGEYAFPLKGTKKVVKNPGMFSNGTASKSGHPYTAYDILADPGTEVVAFMDGYVRRIGEDRCPGRLVGIYNEQADVIVSYLHLSMDRSTHVKLGDKVQKGDKVGIVGRAVEGCGTPHLHIDVAKGSVRPGCSRLSCPSANASQFVDVGKPLYDTYQALPD